MKKLLLSFLAILSFASIQANGWTPVTERDTILQNITTIRRQNLMIKNSYSPGSSAYKYQDDACHESIFKYLKSIGSVTSYAILKEMCANGQLPASYLSNA